MDFEPLNRLGGEELDQHVEKETITIGNANLNELNTASTSAFVENSISPPDLGAKRKPGRPKGSRNKTSSAKSIVDDPPKPRGRPPGTGHKQLAHARALSLGADLTEPETEPKRPVGRPRKTPAPRAFSAHIGTRDFCTQKSRYFSGNDLNRDSDPTKKRQRNGAIVTMTIAPLQARPTIPGMPAVIRTERGREAADASNPDHLHSIFIPPTNASAPTPIPPIPPLPQTRSADTRVPDIPNTPPDIVIDENADEYNHLLNDGLGEEFEEDDNGDEDDLEFSDDGPKPRRTAHALPKWLEAQFKALVAESSIRDTDNLPPLYKTGKTFWFPPYFSLKDLRTIIPEDLFHAQFFLWDPQAHQVFGTLLTKRSQDHKTFAILLMLSSQSLVLPVKQRFTVTPSSIVLAAVLIWTAHFSSLATDIVARNAVAKNVLDLILKGFISDPPGIALYVEAGIDPKTDLILWRCRRGTNSTEGGVHTHLRSRMPTSGASIRHINACLKDFILRHNLLVGTFNTTGKRYRGHYSLWLTNEIQELLTTLDDILISPKIMTGWVNGNLYQPTNEVSGVLPIPDDVRFPSAMAPFEPSLDPKQQHRHLASLQGTRKAVLPIHNDAEKKLFKDFMSSGHSSFGNFSSSAQVEKAVRAWNARADTDKDIYYKLPEQLKVYYNGDWKTNSNIKQTKATTADKRGPTLEQIYSPERMKMAPKVPQTAMRVHDAPTGTHESLEKPPSHVSFTGISSGSTSASNIAATAFAAGSSRSTANAPVEESMPVHEGRSRQEMLQDLAAWRVENILKESEPAPPAKRQKRSCRKCGKIAGECRGAKELLGFEGSIAALSRSARSAAHAACSVNSHLRYACSVAECTLNGDWSEQAQSSKAAHAAGNTDSRSRGEMHAAPHRSSPEAVKLRRGRSSAPVATAPTTREGKVCAVKLARTHESAARAEIDVSWLLQWSQYSRDRLERKEGKEKVGHLTLQTSSPT
ncbi:hypothetical protein DFH07DRAFT_771904 [Mycena maculata]|uniref:Uncharacterized protein n=1 Tax=Mycena maculata TaxID=230809 RepID=A0AAD7NHA5_9AGAR|nr:hypothetical protein DFH07DRAFT_771904 [Mycena maculata]